MILLNSLIILVFNLIGLSMAHPTTTTGRHIHHPHVSVTVLETVVITKFVNQNGEPVTSGGFQSIANTITTTLPTSLPEVTQEVSHSYSTKSDFGLELSPTETKVETEDPKPTEPPAPIEYPATPEAFESSSHSLGDMDMTETSNPEVTQEYFYTKLLEEATSVENPNPQESDKSVPSEPLHEGVVIDIKTNEVFSNALGITYSPYNSDNSCKSREDIKKDVSRLSSFKVLRTYGVDCNQAAMVMEALGEHQKIMLGVYDVNRLEEELEAINEAVKSHPRQWESVYLITIGNELVNFAHKSSNDMIKLTQQARRILASYGYNGPVSTVDTFIAHIDQSGLCEASDVICINAHPFFDGKVSAANAGEWLQRTISRVSAVCPGKPIIVTEAGWPHNGFANDQAVPSREQQRLAVESILNHAGPQTILFTAFDDAWKPGGLYGVEKHWGIFPN